MTWPSPGPCSPGPCSWLDIWPLALTDIFGGLSDTVKELVSAPAAECKFVYCV